MPPHARQYPPERMAKLSLKVPRAPPKRVIVFVAMDQVEGKPTAVPSWTPETEDDKRLAATLERVLAAEGHDLGGSGTHPPLSLPDHLC